VIRPDPRLVPVRSGTRRLLPRRESVELLGVALRPADHFTRLWPSSPERPRDAAFLVAMLPVRLAGLLVLWVTSTPHRLIITAAALTALALIR